MRRSAWLGLCALVACWDSTAQPALESDAGGTSPDGSTASTDGGTSADGGLPACPAFAAPTSRGNVAAPAITEASGLVASRRSDGILWTHNDSGDTPRLFALRAADGSLVGETALSGADAVDWEDIAAGTFGGAPALFIGDIGDNAARRASVVVYVAPEPDAAALPTSVAVSLKMTLTYEDGPRDAEALLVDPRSGDLVIIEKSLGPAGVYVLSPPFAASGVLRRAATLDLTRSGVGTLVTAADALTTGDAVLVRTYGGALWFPRGPGALASALTNAPCPLPAAVEGQGETIAASTDGATFFTLSEGASQPLHAAARR